MSKKANPEGIKWPTDKAKYDRNYLRLYGEKEMNICDDCGKAKEDVHLTTCPYTEEIHDEREECYLCDDCYSERMNDI